MSNDNALKQAALDYHRLPTKGKVSVTPTKNLVNSRDLSLAYSPGVAFPCLEIERDPLLAHEYTSRGNLVGVITNGTAVLGLGDIGPLAGKPVMEGKACLFKKFADIDVFDIELAENNVDKLVEIIAAMEPTLGGINLEDIKAPECFEVEKRLRDRLSIPVFHDDQHGTAIISAAAILNALKIVNKNITQAKFAVSGAGAAAIACLDMLVLIGASPKNIFVSDSKGVIWKGRDAQMEPNKARYAQDTDGRVLADILKDADVFLGCSSAGILKPEMLKAMAPRPIILALANPEPEIRPEVAKEARPDCIIATGRSDYPNQVNNVLCFPYIFRGALDVGASKITEEMKLACVYAIAELAQVEVNDSVAQAYMGQPLSFGDDYIIPKPFDNRLIVKIAPAVAEAAMKSGVATRPIKDLNLYRQSLDNFVNRTGMIMAPVFTLARKAQKKRVIYAEGDDPRVLRAAQIAVDESLAYPILIGKHDKITRLIKELNLRLDDGKNIQIIDPDKFEKIHEFSEQYHQLRAYSGIAPNVAEKHLLRYSTLFSLYLLKNGYGDAMLCGTTSVHAKHMRFVSEIVGLKNTKNIFSTMNALQLQDRVLFIADTYINENPSAEDIAEITQMAAEEIRRFGLEPKVALLSHSNFGSMPSDSSRKMAKAKKILWEQCPNLEVDGEMQGDSALSETLRSIALPNSRLSGEANLLIMPNLDSANIAFNLIKMINGGGVTVGPILLGSKMPVHILTPSASTRRIVNMTALAVADAQI
jgi:malate dehydrogenase (oxaloacetate-decarboxylating)(NADP+)